MSEQVTDLTIVWTCDEHKDCYGHKVPVGAVVPEIRQRLLDYDKIADQLEQERVRLAGCLVAAEGGTKEVATQGMYGWSLSYQKTLELRLERDELARKYREAMELLQKVMWLTKNKELKERYEALKRG